MAHSYTEPELVEFLNFTVKKGLLNEATARSRKIAAVRVLEALDDHEKADLRTIDRDSVFQRFVNKSGKDFAPNSLQSYRSRFFAALDDFIRYTDNPVTFKPGGGGIREIKGSEDTKKPVGRRPKAAASTARVNADSAMNAVIPRTVPEMLRLSYPIRADVLAEVAVPRGMTLDEARRFCAFVMTLATDFVPGVKQDF